MQGRSWRVMGVDKSSQVFIPNIVLMFIVLTVSFLGDGLRDAFDPQSLR